MNTQKDGDRAVNKRQRAGEKCRRNHQNTKMKTRQGTVKIIKGGREHWQKSKLETER